MCDVGCSCTFGTVLPPQGDSGSWAFSSTLSVIPPPLYIMVQMTLGIDAVLHRHSDLNLNNSVLLGLLILSR